MSMGQRIKDSRKKAGLTQVALARKAGFAQTNLTDYERDKVLPPVDKLVKIATACEVSLEWLITGIEPKASKKTTIINHDVFLEALKKVEMNTEGYAITIEKKAELILNLYDIIDEDMNRIEKELSKYKNAVS